MANIRLDQLGAAIEAELEMYHDNVVREINTAGEASIKKMVQLTKASAPKRTGKLKKAITYKALDAGHGAKTYVLHAKAPSHRIFHLAVHGHATSTGGRARGNSFLADAVSTVLPEHERAVEEAIRNG